MVGLFLKNAMHEILNRGMFKCYVPEMTTWTLRFLLRWVKH